jgi:hypothetical protein
MQDYDNLEILVSDNFSQDLTRDVVESFKDKRIRYINTGKRLSMTDNYEFALSHVRPEGYVIYIGDDDGLLPNAIHNINTVTDETGALVLRWELPTYWWPTVGNNAANQLTIPALGSGVRILNSSKTIQDILSFKKPYTVSLPLMYQYSAINYEIIRKIRGKSERFYNSMTPDVYSGFAIAGAVNKFHYSRKPYTISGVSHNSIGASTQNTFLTDPSLKFYNENKCVHSDLLFCVSVPQCIIECFLQARDHLPYFQKFTLDMEKLIFEMMKDAAPKAEDIYLGVKKAVLYLGQTHHILETAQHAIATYPNRKPGSRRKLTVRNVVGASLHVTHQFVNDLRKGNIYLNCSSLNVKNIYDASILCDQILSLKEMKVFDYWTICKTSLLNIKKIIAPDVHDSVAQTDSAETIHPSSVNDRETLGDSAV